MQKRPYPEKDGARCWLSRPERKQMLEIYDDDPRRQLALQLALHGLRQDEIRRVARTHFRELSGHDGYKLVIPDGKTGRRECPVATDVYQTASILSNAAGLRQDEPMLDVTTKTLRNWLDDATDTLGGADAPTNSTGWRDVTLHDLRRTWATDTFYSLAFSGVPIAEELTMGWGGWAMTSTGRETFRENYLGPEPDHITAQAVEYLPFEN